MLQLIGKSTAIILFIASLFCGAYALADDASEMAAAIEKTQKDLRSSQTRQGMTKESPEAANVAEKVKSMSGSSANENEMYDLAADVLGNMKGLSQEQLMKVMQEAQKDPEGFLKTWTPEQRKKLEGIADRLPASKKGKQP
ncbi:hypothetical protein [Bdellovibrio sp. KM01]|uniref:hypothetical protein n=1 Tax=Bdellovibrio sp. KM01 TaxID=2748865 RepID=UPI0015E9A9D1|nr:hypothetical protein [Bdellovibrio sp. KM01]QLY24045.1 hypothetical protein HW988_11215 [Bdellovibrio sp. KM01]